MKIYALLFSSSNHHPVAIAKHYRSKALSLSYSRALIIDCLSTQHPSMFAGMQELLMGSPDTLGAHFSLLDP